MIRRHLRTRTMYMHTMDGKPAAYEPGRQVVFVNQGPYARGKGAALCSDVKQIHAQWKASLAWRKARGLGADGWVHGYIRVMLPE